MSEQDYAELRAALAEASELVAGGCANVSRQNYTNQRVIGFIKPSNDIELVDGIFMAEAVRKVVQAAPPLLAERDGLREENERLRAALTAFVEAGGAAPRSGIVRFSMWSLVKLSDAFDLAAQALSGEGSSCASPPLSPKSDTPDAAPSGWRPVDDAARAADQIIAGSINHDRRACVRWRDGHDRADLGADPDKAAGWVDPSEEGDRLYFNPLFFTHYQPLPSAPSPGEKP